MLTFTQIVQHISELSRSPEPAEETLINFLNSLRGLADELTPQILQQFIYDTLDYPYWQQKRGILTKALKSILAEALDDYKIIRWPDEIQVFEVERLDEQMDLIHNYLKSNLPLETKSRVLFDPYTKKRLSLNLLPSKELSINQFGSRFFLSQGHLIPLRSDLRLLFGKDLELVANCVHKLEVAPFSTATFCIRANLVTGSTVYGYSMKRQQEFRGEALSQTGRLLYSVKRFEQFFLKKESNPFYSELTLSLERMVNMVKMGESEAVAKAHNLVLHAKNCLEHVFIGDKFLSLLLRELQDALPTGSTWQKQSDLTN